jgi:hypothetical protein
VGIPIQLHHRQDRTEHHLRSVVQPQSCTLESRAARTQPEKVPFGFTYDLYLPPDFFFSAATKGPLAGPSDSEGKNAARIPNVSRVGE